MRYEYIRGTAWIIRVAVALWNISFLFNDPFFLKLSGDCVLGL